MTMHKGTKFKIDIYELVRKARMTEHDRRIAVEALQNAEALVELTVWVTNKVEHLAHRLFLKPSLKH